MNKEANKEPEMDSMGGCLIRIFSILLGPVFLMMCAVIMAAYQTAFPGTLDIIYGIILMLMVIARLIDRPPVPADKPAGSPADRGKPAESGHSPVIKYSIIIFVAGVALWVVARFVLSQVL